MAVSGSSIDIGSDNQDLTCDVCKYQNVTTVAISYCNLCQEALCTSCDRVHRAARQTRDHKLLTGNQLLSISARNQTPAMMTCDKHHMTIEYYCEADAALCCSKCKITAHNKCDLTDVKTYAAHSKPTKDFSSMQEILKRLQRSYENLQNKKKKDKIALKQQIQHCLEKMKKIRIEFNDVLTELENEMAKKIQDLETRIDKSLEEHLTIINDTLNQVHTDIKSMEECEKTNLSEVIFVGLKKIETELPTYETIVESLERELQEINVQFCQDKLVTETLNSLTSIGKINSVNNRCPNFSVLDIRKNELQEIVAIREMVQSIVCMPDGHVILACQIDGLKLLDAKFKMLSNMDIRAIMACAASNDEVLISQGKEKQLLFVDLFPKMKTKQRITLDRVCCGVDFRDDTIYVTCHDNPGDGEIRVLSRNGDLKQRIGFNNESYMFICPWDVKLSEHGDRIFVTDRGDNSVTCLDPRGQIIYRFSNAELDGAYGMYVDQFNNLLVCGRKSNNVLIIDAKGNKHSTLLYRNKFVDNPVCVSYMKSDGYLILGQASTKHGSLLSMKV